MSKLAHRASILLFAIGGAHPMFAQAAIQEPGANAFYHPNADVALGNACAMVAAWRPVARAERPRKIWRIGFLAHRHETFYDPLLQSPEELGYREGQNLTVERRYVEGYAELFQEFANELVQLNVDPIVVTTPPAGLAAKRATSTIPVVYPAAIDPIGTGLIASLVHPGGNLTGLSVLGAEMSAERLEVLREFVPALSTAALLWDAANPANSLAWKQSKYAAGKLGVRFRSLEIRTPSDLESAFDMRPWRVNVQRRCSFFRTR
jgi:putative tryptophan/tyrosine transport system substrate-binding protein